MLCILAHLSECISSLLKAETCLTVLPPVPWTQGVRAKLTQPCPTL